MTFAQIGINVTENQTGVAMFNISSCLTKVTNK